MTIKLIAFLQSESFQKRDSEEALIFNKIKSITPEMITGFEFTDKVVGIIGCGRVAQALAAELQPHCQAILGYDEDPRYVYERFHLRNPLVRPRIEYCALPELLERADIITIHTSGPFKVFRGQQLLRAKRKPCIIDTARDGTIDEASLLSALKGKKIRSAALTIPYQQIKHADYTDYVKQLIAFRNVVIAPSLGKPITAAHKKNSLALARAVIAYLLNGDLSLAVNPYAVAGLEERTSYPLSVQGRRGAVPFFLNS